MPRWAACCLVETEVNASKSVQNAVSKQLLIQVNSPKERLAARLAAGKALGRLGDPRMHSRQSVVTLADGKTVSFIAPDWVEVPQGAFMMGSLATDKLSSGDEQPQHDVLLSKGYRIGRFPVTVAEYRCFLEAEGYSNDEYWQDEAGLRWLRGELSFEESYQAQLFNIFTEDKERVQRYYEHEVREKRIAPYMADAVIRGLDKPVGAYIEEWQNLEKEHRDETGRASHPWLWDDPDYTISNQPVVGVSFYEARAYADWLEKVMSSAGLVPPGFHVRLPYEAEWEKAARGVDARRWPWGIRWDTGRANTLEGRVLSPSPVGIYPHGASPYSAQDMAGNVWQWCQDWYDENEYARRAGSAVTDPRGPESG